MPYEHRPIAKGHQNRLRAIEDFRRHRRSCRPVFRSLPDCPEWRHQDTISRIGGPQESISLASLGVPLLSCATIFAAQGGFNVGLSQQLSRRTVIADANNNDIRFSNRFLDALGYAETEP